MQTSSRSILPSSHTFFLLFFMFLATQVWMKARHTLHKKVNTSSPRLRRTRICAFVLLFLVLLGAVLHYRWFDVATTIEDVPTYTIENVEALGGCLLPGSYTSLSPGACVLTTNGTMQVMAGETVPSWKQGECKATLYRLAPWLRPTRQDLAAAPLFQCTTRNRTNSNNMPLFVVLKKDSTSYSVTEPLWMSLTAPNIHHKEKNNNSQSHCPDLYLTSHTYRYGGTFNQIQSVLSAIWLSKVLNRTYVLPLLSTEHDKKDINIADAAGVRKAPLELYFDFDKLRASGYCIVNYSTFETDMLRRFPDQKERKLVYYEHLRQSYYPHLFLNNAADMAPLLSPPSRWIQSLKFSYSFGKLSELLPPEGATSPLRVALPSAPLLMVESVVGFHVRAPFQEAMHILGLLEPAPAIAAKVEEVLHAHQGRHTVAIHLRYREGACEREQKLFNHYLWPSTNGSKLSFERSDEGQKSIFSECAYSAEETMQKVRIVMKDLLPYTTYSSSAASLSESGKANKRIEPKDVAILLAVDHQRPEAIQLLQQKAMLNDFSVYLLEKEHKVKGYYTGFEKKLYNVVVDYFLLVRAEVFFGNRMSSISQCACMARLGQGKGCHGVPAGFLRALFFPDLQHIFH